MDNREYCLLSPITDEKADSKWVEVQMVETWRLLERRHPTVGDVPYAVTILSGEFGEGGYDAGSAGSALYRLLQASNCGWTVGTVDVDGFHDLETEKLSLLQNIMEVQRIWGGWLVFDSINKTISLRDELKWENDTGFQLRYKKNQKSLKKITDYSTIVTRIIPFGEKDLNIAAVNDGVLYLEDYTHCSELRELIWKREDIYDQDELKEMAQAYLDQYSRPRVQYEATMLDLSTLEGYEHETFKLGDMVTIHDEELANDVKVRLISHSYDVFQPWKCDIRLGDPIRNRLEDLSSAISSGNYVQDVIYPSRTLGNVRKGLQTWQVNSIDSVDSEFGLTLNIYLPPTTKKVMGALMRFKLLKYRAYSRTSSSGGGQTVSISADSSGSTSMLYWSSEKHSHTVSDSSTSSDNIQINVPSHTHGISHSHTVSSHNHGLVYGIYEDTTATDITVKINGTDRTTALGGSFTTDQSSLEIKDYLVAGQWNEIVLGSSRLGRIDASVFLQAIIA